MLLQSKSDLKSWLVKAGDKKKRVFIGEQEEDDDAEKINFCKQRMDRM